MSKCDDPRVGSLFINQEEKNSFIKSIKVAFIGYANDEGVSRNGGRSGASEGPNIIRGLLKKKGCILNDEYNISIDDIKIKDFGNTSGSQDLKSVHETHQQLVQNALNEGYVPIIVGGGNDQSYPNFLALLRHIELNRNDRTNEKLLVINIDAHLDVRPLLEGDEPHSGSPFRQILETKTDASLKFVEFGCQGSQCSSEHVKYVMDKGGKIIWLKELHGSIVNGDIPFSKTSDFFEQIISNDSYSNSFISFDIDSIRYGDCPGVSCPSPVGITAEEALSICYKSGRCHHVRMIDFSEFNPKVESYMTGTLLSNMIYYFIMGLVDRKITQFPKK